MAPPAQIGARMPTPRHPFDIRNIALALSLCGALIAGCQSSVESIPGEVDLSHHRTVTTFTKASAPVPPTGKTWRVRVIHPGDSSENTPASDPVPAPVPVPSPAPAADPR